MLAEIDGNGEGDGELLPETIALALSKIAEAVAETDAVASGEGVAVAETLAVEVGLLVRVADNELVSEAVKEEVSLKIVISLGEAVADKELIALFDKELAIALIEAEDVKLGNID